jgi:hypothetical protein
MPRRPKGDGKLTTDDQPKTGLKRSTRATKIEERLVGKRGKGVQVQAQ